MTTNPKTIVSTDVVENPVSVGNVGGGLTIIPMSEVKQSAVRATRATVPAFVVLAGGGTVAQAATGAGVPPLLMVGLPSTGMFVLDILIICAVIWVLWFAWNLVEFWLDLDETNPKIRA